MHLRSAPLFLAGVLAMMTGAAPALAADAPQKVRIATEGAYPPFNFKAPDGSLQGFDVDIANAVCAEAHLDCTIVAQDWDGIIPGLLAKKYDAIVASMAVTEERKKKVAFTNKYYNTPPSWIAPKDSKITSWDAEIGRAHV